ncbi:carboxymuconolactone decarboxylase family protein [Nemorincola caseinilytica]|uniref:Alkyl hydroperoxide reductase AhpD n=1 Tax=Nemorincola caseinilytica TaxID=2054315 RepID=A0ABP8NIK8_9BACT
MNTTTTNETIQTFFQDLGIDAGHTSKSLEAMAAVNQRYLRDMKLNVNGVLNSASMTKKEAAILALSIAANEKNDILIAAFEKRANAEGANAEEIAETHACASMMALNNIFYRFRHYMHANEFYNKQPAGLRMSIMMNPVMGKPLFELMSLAISAVNGCERCVTSHEHSVKEQGASDQRIYDAVRLAAVIKGLCTVM